MGLDGKGGYLQKKEAALGAGAGSLMAIGSIAYKGRVEGVFLQDAVCHPEQEHRRVPPTHRTHMC